jgi:hypothetical protein
MSRQAYEVQKVDANALQQLAEERPAGGSTVGYLFNLDGAPVIGKTSLDASLMVQIWGHQAKGDKEKEKVERKAGFIAADLMNFIHGSDEYGRVMFTNADEAKKAEFKKQEEAFKKLLAESVPKQTGSSNISDIVAALNEWDKSLLKNDAIAAIVNNQNNGQGLLLSVHAGQLYTEALVANVLTNSGINVPSTKVAYENHVPLLVTSALQKDKGFDQYLTEPFLNGAPLSKAREDRAFVVTPESIEKGKAELAEKLKKEPQLLRGLVTSLITRYALGERSDVGPDNMLSSPDGITNVDFGRSLQYAVSIKTAFDMLDRLETEKAPEKRAALVLSLMQPKYLGNLATIEKTGADGKPKKEESPLAKAIKEVLAAQLAVNSQALEQEIRNIRPTLSKAASNLTEAVKKTDLSPISQRNLENFSKLLNTQAQQIQRS